MNSELSILTWNVWFGGKPWDDAKKRYTAIFNTVLDLKPDVACFQEATFKFITVSGSRNA